MREVARDQGWFDRLSRREQQAYLRDHPRSRMRPSASAPRAKKAAQEKPTLAREARPEDFTRNGVGLEDGEDATEVASAWNATLRSVPPDRMLHGMLAGSGLTPSATVREVNVGQGVVMHVSGHDEHGHEIMSAKRIFRQDPKGTVVEHRTFHVAHDSQGHGVSKHFLRGSVAQYQRAGVRRVDLSANIDVGGYAWARYGFVPHASEWKGLRKRLGARLKTIARSVPASAREHVERLLASDDPHAVWDIADLSVPVRAARNAPGKRVETLPLGKHLLLNSTWDGGLDLHDEHAMGRFHAYVGES